MWDKRVKCKTQSKAVFSRIFSENGKIRRPDPIGRQPRVVRTGNVLLLVDRRIEPAARFYLSTGGENDSDEGHTQDSSPVSGDSRFDS